MGVKFTITDSNDLAIYEGCQKEFDSIKKQATCVSKPQKVKIEPAFVKVELPIPKVETESIEILKSSTRQKFIEILIDKLGVEKSEIRPESNIIDDFGADSLDSVELIMEIEKEFNITIPDNDAEKLVIVSDAIQYLNIRKNTGVHESKNRIRKSFKSPAKSNIVVLNSENQKIRTHEDFIKEWYNFLVLKYPNAKFSLIEKRIEAKDFPLQGINFSTDYGFCTLDLHYRYNSYFESMKEVLEDKLSDYKFYWNKRSSKMMIYGKKLDDKFSNQEEYNGIGIDILKKELEKMML